MVEAMDVLDMPQTANESCSSLTDAIEEAAKLLPLVWPMQTFIASNPLRDLETNPFESALEEALELYSHPHLQESSTQTINRLLIKWCQIFFDRGQAALTCVDQDDDFYTAWRKNQPHDPELSEIKTPPADPLETIRRVAKSLGLKENDWVTFCKLQFTALPGWGGWVKRLDRWEEDPSSATLIQFLAVRLALFAHFDGKCPQLKTERLLSTRMEEIKQAETVFCDQILQGLGKQKAPSSIKADAQWVFCIDTRSEPIRRHLEQVGANETFGFAGFFGLPVAIQTRKHKEACASCPIILKPQFQVTEKGPQNGPSQMNRKEKSLRSFGHLFLTFKKNSLTPFTLVESLGFFSGISSLFATLFPVKVRKLYKKWTRQAQTHFTPTEEELDLDSMTNAALGFLKGIGLTSGFAPYVILCGHGSETANNPHASALQCGACGGHEGGPNAQIMASILNNEEVRKELEKNGITIPSTTRFLAALHETTTDSIEFFGSDASQALKEEAQAARSLTQEEKKHNLQLKGKGERLATHFSKRSASWSETRPEWGLARNGAFIIAPRQTSQAHHLDGRAFLHSYDSKLDPDGNILQNILAGPVTVAHWINMQYLFSTLHPTLFGGGSKVTHNITGRFGLMQGNGSDLMHGLPLQSLFQDDETPHHTPVRLHVLIEAPEALIEKALDACPGIKQAIASDWLKLERIPEKDERVPKAPQ